MDDQWLSDDWLDAYLTVKDQPVDGGCDDCHAYQTVEEFLPGVAVLLVHHSPGCPFLSAQQEMDL
jgi:hypothetical protein